jgi:beta-N-acetylhexosaminidase
MHVPGQGRAGVDSHHALPVVEASLEALEGTDFAPFRRLAHMPWAMTAHVLYGAVDAERPATTSGRVVAQVVRGAIGFDGVLITDALSMDALAGDLAERARAAIAAGCDLALHCNGDLGEMERIAGATPALGAAARARLERAAAMRRAPDDFDPAAAARRLAALLGDADAA